MFNEIKDFAAPELDVYARTSEVQLLRYYEPEPGIFIAESPKVIERALNAGYQPISFLVEHKDLEGEAQEILKQYPDVPVYTAEYELLVKLTGFALTRGMLCAMRRNPLPSVEEICRNASRIAVLENVVNPTNIGAIFRSAAALHMDAVLLTGGCSDPLYRRAARVSMGTVFQIPWTYFDKKTARILPPAVHFFHIQLFCWKHRCLQLASFGFRQLIRPGMVLFHFYSYCHRISIAVLINALLHAFR